MCRLLGPLMLHLGTFIPIRQGASTGAGTAPFGFHVSRSSPSSLRCGPTLAQLCDDELSEHPALTNCENNTGVAGAARILEAQAQAGQARLVAQEVGHGAAQSGVVAPVAPAALDSA